MMDNLKRKGLKLSTEVFFHNVPMLEGVSAINPNNFVSFADTAHPTWVNLCKGCVSIKFKSLVVFVAKAFGVTWLFTAFYRTFSPHGGYVDHVSLNVKKMIGGYSY